MSKKYILLTNAIVNLGGGQIYCNNKYKYLTSIGFETFIFSTHGGKLFVKNLEKFLPLIIDELDFYPVTFDEKTVDRVIEKILKDIDYSENDEVIIESHTPYLAIWGEMIAKKTNAKHIIYLLGETFEGLANYTFEFFDFKYNRKEIACIKNAVMQKMFAPYKTIPEKECFYLQATLGVPVEDIEISEDYIEKCNGKKVIGVIGRGDKSYVFASVKLSCEFAKKHKEDNFVLLVIGSKVKGITEEIESFVKNYSNVELILTGDQFPIPKKMLGLMNVAFASAGCVRPPYYGGIPTITIDAYDNNPIGVMGYDTLVTAVREKEEYKSADYYLNEILYGDFVNKNDFIAPEPIDFNVAYGKHFEFINNSQTQKDYYEFLNITKTKKDKILSILYKIGGIKLIRWVRTLRRKY